MTRNAVILIFVCALAGVVYFSCYDFLCIMRKAESDFVRKPGADSVSTGSVYALRDIGAGEVIRRGDFKEQNARIGGSGKIGSISDIEGFRTSERIDEGQELTSCQINFRTKYVKSVVGVRHLLPGSVVQEGDVVEGYAPETVNAVKDKSMVVGKQVMREFHKADIIMQDMIGL